MATLVKTPHRKRSQLSGTRRPLEKFDTNHLIPTTPTSRKPKTPTPAQGRKKISSCKKEEVSEKVTYTEVGVGELEGSSKVRKMKSIMLEEAMSSVPEPGDGRVMHMVKAFERILSFNKKEGSVDKETKKGRVVNWALPGLQQHEEIEVSSYSDFSSSPEQSSVDSSGDRLSWKSSRSGGVRRSRSKELRATSHQLGHRRSRSKCLVKPSVKEFTEPIDLVLHTEVERAEFDFHVAERLSLIEQIKLERERRRKMEKKKEIRRLRKEAPKAQHMPYFDRPFILTR